MRSAYGPVLTCAVTYAIALVCARIAFEEGSNAATVVTLRCTFAAIAIGIAIRIRGAPDTTTARDRRLIVALGVLVIAGVVGTQLAHRSG